MLTYGLIGIFAITFLVIMIKINIAENKQIFSNPEYSMGELKSYSGRVGAIVVPNLVNFQPKPASVTYSFRVGTSIYFNSYNDAKYIIPSAPRCRRFIIGGLLSVAEVQLLIRELGIYSSPYLYQIPKK